MKLDLMVLKNMLECIKVEKQYREELIESALIYVDGMIEESEEEEYYV